MAAKKILFKGGLIRGVSIIAKGTGSSSGLAGVVADGYIKSASVLVKDAQTGRVVARGVTDNSGSYSINISTELPEYVLIESLGGIDISTQQPFTGTLKNVKHSSTALEPTVISPITTIVAAIATAPNTVVSLENINTAISNVATALNVSVSDVDADFISGGNTVVAKEAAKIATVLKVITNKIGGDVQAAAAAAVIAIAGQITSTTVQLDLSNTNILKTVITAAATETGNSTVISNVASNLDTIAATTQVITQTIEDIDETIDSGAALEALAELNAVTSVIIKPETDLSDIDADAIALALDQVETFFTELPIVSTVPSPAYTPWTKINYPELDPGLDICIGGVYITVSILDHWKMYTGMLDPISLSVGALKRLDNHTGGAAQSGDSVIANTLYSVSISGAGRYTLHGATGVQWSDGSTSDFIDISNQTVTVSCTVPPQEIRIASLVGDNDISEITMSPVVDGIIGSNIIQNSNFTQLEEHFYDIEAYHLDQDDPGAIDPYSVGWIAGFHEGMIFNMFGLDVELPEDLLAPTNATTTINQDTVNIVGHLQQPTDVNVTINYS